MIFWILAVCVTLAVLAALFYAARGAKVNAAGQSRQSATRSHHKALLDEIEADHRAGRFSDAEAEAARAELAREVLRSDAENADTEPVTQTPQIAMVGALLFVGVLSFATYVAIGNPSLPAQPIASRAEPDIADMSLEDAIARVERRLSEDPSDVRGWAVLGPIYMQMNRFEEAVIAFRNVVALNGPTADGETDLAEAVMMANGGQAQGEPLALLQSAADRDPAHIRSRFYLAGEAMREQRFEDAERRWRELLALANGEEPWVEPARRGLRVAQARLNGEAPPSGVAADVGQSEAIRGMVEGLASRLEADGGTIEEWTRLVRSYIVLGERNKAQAAYDAAKSAYPETDVRDALDRMALDAGLE